MRRPAIVKDVIERICFNPRTRMGCDLPWLIIKIFKPKFQSTHPHGVRPNGHCLYTFPCHQFQSTHPHGVRLTTKEVKMLSIVFQSTHPHGVRPERGWESDRFNQVSIHAPAWGATNSPLGPPRLLGVSIHAPAWGATVTYTTHHQG